MIWKRRMAQQKGPCPFIVHGLTGEEFSTKTMKTIKAIALQHLTSEGKIHAMDMQKHQSQYMEIPNYSLLCYLGCSLMV